MTVASLHATAIHELTNWDPPTPEQAGLRADFLERLADDADCLWRRHGTGHFTASTAVFTADFSKTLLSLHPVLGIWLQMGGHLEAGDDSLAGAALREANEESGIGELTMKPLPVWLGRFEDACGPLGACHYDVQYAAVAADGARERISDESLDLRWFPVDELPDSCDDATRTLVLRALERLQPS